MNISINTSLFNKMGKIDDILTELKNAGFDAYDYSMTGDCPNINIVECADYIQKAKKIRALADGVGIVCNQTHAPFPSWKTGEEDYNEKTFKLIVRAIEITAILGGKICVVHPWNYASAEENAEFYLKLLPFLKENNVKIGVENMWGREGEIIVPAACSDEESYLKHIKLLPEEWFTVNLDIGHAQMKGLNTSAVEIIDALKGRIGALHVHDNNCDYRDSHSIPFTGKIDFPAVCAALKRAGYAGDVTLEVKNMDLPAPLIPAAMKFMAQTANYLRDLIKN